MAEDKNGANYIHQVSDLVASTEAFVASKTVLFRGQDCNEPLLPKVSRRDPTSDTSESERQMLEELKRRSAHDPALVGKDDWDCLVYAQHYGMATRLLDWTTNPLVALWFAVSNPDPSCDGYVFLLFADDDLMLDKGKNPDPFKILHTRILKPNMNNPRVVAQAGWFTAHRFSKKSGRFVDLHANWELKSQVLMKGVPGHCKAAILRSLDRLGVNQESIFGGMEGTCRYLNWLYGIRS